MASKKSLDGVLIKKANQREQFTEEQISELQKCMDPVTGPKYFANNFFYIQHPVQGRLLFKMYPYQERLMDAYNSHRFTCNMLSRQMGKTTCAAAYLLWYAMFNPDQTILVSAHKFSGAQEIMQRLRYGYESCPDFIRCGVVNYNKGSMDFENGSRIISATTTATTGRGLAISLLYCLDGDSTVRIRNKNTLKEEDISLKDLYSRLHNPINILT